MQKQCVPFVLFVLILLSLSACATRSSNPNMEKQELRLAALEEKVFNQDQKQQSINEWTTKRLATLEAQHPNVQVPPPPGFMQKETIHPEATPLLPPTAGGVVDTVPGEAKITPGTPTAPTAASATNTSTNSPSASTPKGSSALPPQTLTPPPAAAPLVEINAQAKSEPATSLPQTTHTPEQPNTTLKNAPVSPQTPKTMEPMGATETMGTTETAGTYKTNSTSPRADAAPQADNLAQNLAQPQAPTSPQTSQPSAYAQATGQIPSQNEQMPPANAPIVQPQAGQPQMGQPPQAAPPQTQPTAPATAPTISAKNTSAQTTGTDKSAYAAALSLLERGKTEQGKAAMEAFLEHYPQSALAPNAMYWRGEALYTQLKFEDAIISFKDVLVKYPKNNKAPDALLKIGMSYQRLSDKDNAKFYLQMLLEDYPSSRSAGLGKKLLAGLK